MAYAKFITAVIGMIVLAVRQFAGVDLGDDFTNKMSDVVIMILTAVGVFGVKNSR